MVIDDGPRHSGQDATVVRVNGDHWTVVRPGVVYGGGEGMIGDIFKSASNGLVRVVGDGNNHWPLVYDRDLADLYARLAAHPLIRTRTCRDVATSREQALASGAADTAGTLPSLVAGSASTG